MGEATSVHYKAGFFNTNENTGVISLMHIFVHERCLGKLGPTNWMLGNHLLFCVLTSKASHTIVPKPRPDSYRKRDSASVQIARNLQWFVSGMRLQWCGRDRSQQKQYLGF